MISYLTYWPRVLWGDFIDWLLLEDDEMPID